MKKVYLSYHDIHTDCIKLAKIIKKKYNPKKLVIISKGGLIPGSIIAHYLEIEDINIISIRNIKEIKLPMFSATCQYYTPQVEKRNELSDFLAGKEISTSVHFKPISEMTAYRKYVKRPLPVTDKVWPKLLTLPVFNDITWEQVEYIIKMVKNFYE